MVKELSEDLSIIKKIQPETKDSLIETKNNIQGNNRMDEAENWINDLEHKEAKNNQSEQQQKRIQETEDSISSLWDNSKHTNICITEVPEGKDKVRNCKSIWKNNERKLP